MSSPAPSSGELPQKTEEDWPHSDKFVTSTIPAPLICTPDGSLLIMDPDEDLAETPEFATLRPLALKALETTSEGRLNYEQIWSYVEAVLPGRDDLRLPLITLLNSDKRHFFKDVQRFACAAGAINVNYRKCRPFAPAISMREWSVNLDGELRGVERIAELFRKGYVPRISLRLDEDGKQICSQHDREILDFLKTHAVVINPATGETEFVPFTVKMVETPEPPEPENMGEKVINFIEILYPILEKSPQSYVVICSLMKTKFPEMDMDEIRLILRFTLMTYHKFIKCGRTVLEGDFYKVLYNKVQSKPLFKKPVIPPTSVKNIAQEIIVIDDNQAEK